MNAQYPGHIYVMAHSMGNIVTSEALRLAGSSQVVNTYVASQAAVSAHTYDATVSNYSFTRQINVPALGPVNFSFGPNTPNIYGDWFSCNNGGGAGRIINFYNANDYALSQNHWQLDQLLKPDMCVVQGNSIWVYKYNGLPCDPSPWNNFYKTNLNDIRVDFDIVNNLTNRFEVMAYAAQSYTTALGATPGVGNVKRNVDLTSPDNGIWPADPTENNWTEHFWHSAQFRGDNPLMQGYWRELLGIEAFGLK